MITIKETTYKNFGKCLSLSNDAIEVLVTIDVGPRIIKCNLVGHDNLMFEDIERKHVDDVSSLYGAGRSFHNYGGHRLWLSPEKFPDTYYPDTEKVVYSVNQTGAVFEPPVQDVRGLAFTLAVTLDETEPRITVTQTVKNTSKKEVKGSLWCLSALAKGGVVVVPQSTEDTGLLPNRTLVLWPYARVSDPRFYLSDHYVALSQDSSMDVNFKYGINNIVGKILYINGDQALVRSYPVYPDAEYPDGGCSFESYSGKSFIEAETLTPLKTMKCGDAITCTEEWTLVPDVTLSDINEQTLDDLAKRFF